MIHRFFRYGLFVMGLWAGLVLGRAGYLSVTLLRLMIAGGRQPLWRSPASVGLVSETVTFLADDGVTLRGWFIRRPDDDGQPAPAIVFVHGWPWNRLGNRAGAISLPDQDVDLLEPARALHAAGYHVLLFDLRNHGASDAAPPVTFGINEAHDFAGAVAMLRARPTVDGTRIGAIGYSMGANAMLYGIPECQPIRAAVAVQPVRMATFVANFVSQMFGTLGPLLQQAVEPIYTRFGGPPFDMIDPAGVAPRLGETTLLYIQGSGDQWGTLTDVEAIAALTPSARPVFVAPSNERYGGYQYVNSHIDQIVAFFNERLR